MVLACSSIKHDKREDSFLVYLIPLIGRRRKLFEFDGKIGRSPSSAVMTHNGTSV